MGKGQFFGYEDFLLGVFGSSHGVLDVYDSSQHRSGRTTAMALELEEGDTVVAQTFKEQQNVALLLARSRPDFPLRTIRFVICSPDKSATVKYLVGGTLGQVHFTHEWLFEHLKHNMRSMFNDLRKLGKLPR